jgi:hypothetical protein
VFGQPGSNTSQGNNGPCLVSICETEALFVFVAFNYVAVTDTLDRFVVGLLSFLIFIVTALRKCPSQCRPLTDRVVIVITWFACKADGLWLRTLGPAARPPEALLILRASHLSQLKIPANDFSLTTASANERTTKYVIKKMTNVVKSDHSDRLLSLIYRFDVRSSVICSRFTVKVNALDGRCACQRQRGDEHWLSNDLTCRTSHADYMAVRHGIHKVLRATVGQRQRSTSGVFVLAIVYLPLIDGLRTRERV